MIKEYKVTLTWNSTSLVLGYNPAGIDKIGIVLQRHEVYHSVLRSYTLSLRFLNVTHPVNGDGGYNFIKNAYNTNGINAIVECEIKRRNPNTDDYDSFYTGILDFTPNQWTDDRGLFWEIAIIDSSILQKFVSRDENEINLFALKDLDGNVITAPTKDVINLTPVDIVLKYEVNCYGSERVYNLDLGGDYTDFNMDNPIYVKRPNENLTIYNYEDIFTNNNEASSAIKLTVTIDYRWILTYMTHLTEDGYIGYDMHLIHRRTSIIDHIYEEIEQVETTAQNPSVEKVIDLSGLYTKDFTIADFQVGDTIECYIYVRHAFITTPSVFDDSTYNIKITEVTAGLPTTTANSLFLNKAFKAALNITTGINSLDSTITETGGRLQYDAVLNGFLVRNYPDAKLNIKFRDLFKSIDGSDNICLWYDYINQTFVIEDKDFAYQDVLLFDLGEVSKFKRTALKELYFSKITGGYDNEGTYERVQGAYEFAVKREYSTVSTVKETFEIQSPYRRDSVGIEQLRNKQYDYTEAEDSDDDNIVFLVRTNGTNPILPTPYSPLPVGMDIFYSYYNSMVSPRQNVVNWGNVIKNCHYKNTSDFQAQRTEKIYDLVIDGVDENSDIAMSELGTSLFIPELHSFESFLTRENLAILLANPHGYIKFSYNGEKFEVFINKAELSYNNTTVKIEGIPRDISIKYRIFENGNSHQYEHGNIKISE